MRGLSVLLQRVSPDNAEELVKWGELHKQSFVYVVSQQDFYQKIAKIGQCLFKLQLQTIKYFLRDIV